MSVNHSDSGGDVAKKKASKRQDGGDTLGGIAESLGTLLGNAEKQWRAWEGPRNAVVKAVTDVRDRAAALLSEMGAAAEAAAGKGSKKGKKKDKKDKKGKKGKKAEKAERAAAERAAAERAKAEAEKAAAEKAKAEKAARPAKPAKTAKPEKAEKKPRKKARRKMVTEGQGRRRASRRARTRWSPARRPRGRRHVRVLIPHAPVAQVDRASAF